MAFQKRNANNSSRSNDRYEDNRGSRSSRASYSNSGRSSSRGGYQQQQAKTEYLPVLAVFSNDQRGRRSLDIKSHPALQETLTEEQFLFIMSKVYHGELAIHGSLWDCDERYADMRGNIRFTEEGLEEALEGFEAPKSSAKKSKAPAKAKKPVYKEPEPVDEDDEEEVEYEEDDISFEESEDIPY